MAGDPHDDPHEVMAALGNLVAGFGFLDDSFTFALRAVIRLSRFHADLIAGHVDFGTRIAIFEAAVREEYRWPDPPIRHPMPEAELRSFVDRLYKAAKDRNRALHANYRVIATLRADPEEWVEQVSAERAQRGKPYAIEHKEIPSAELDRITKSFVGLGRDLRRWAYPWMLPEDAPGSISRHRPTES